jgi:hypothetical protein
MNKIKWFILSLLVIAICVLVGCAPNDWKEPVYFGDIYQNGNQVANQGDTPSAHASTHDWNSSDPITTDVYHSINAVGSVMMIPLANGLGFTNTTSGTGYVWDGILQALVGSGITNASYSGHSLSGAAWHNHNSGDLWSWSMATWGLFGNNGCSNEEMWLGFFNDPWTFPTTTSNHYGVHVYSNSNNRAYVTLSQGNGSAETSYTIINSLNDWTSLRLYVVYGYSNVIYYYSNNAGNTWSTVTLSTNQPGDSGTSLYWGMWIKTTEPLDKQCQAFGLRLTYGAGGAY